MIEYIINKCSDSIIIAEEPVCNSVCGIFSSFSGSKKITEYFKRRIIDKIGQKYDEKPTRLTENKYPLQTSLTTENHLHIIYIIYREAGTADGSKHLASIFSACGIHFDN